MHFVHIMVDSYRLRLRASSNLSIRSMCQGLRPQVEKDISVQMFFEGTEYSSRKRKSIQKISCKSLAEPEDRLYINNR